MCNDSRWCVDIEDDPAVLSDPRPGSIAGLSNSGRPRIPGRSAHQISERINAPVRGVVPPCPVKPDTH
ncbi:hypothetical protein GCM10025787_43740 [Saccharopolyspora rosea]